MTRSGKKVKWILMLFLLVVTVVVWWAVFLERRDGLMRVSFLNVGQGDAIFIEAPNGNQVLIDGGGPDGAVLRELGRVMSFFDRTIDVVVETHPDQDHIGGLPEVFTRFAVSYFLSPGIENPTAPTEALRHAVLKEVGIVPIEARRGMVLGLGEGVFLHVLFPDRDVSTIETNTGSIILKVVYGSTSVLLTGDAPSSIESYLVALDGEGLESDLLKLGHHGSRTSSSPAFIEAVSPDFAIISAGKDNRYGHPHQEVLENLRSFDVPYLSTAEEGTLRFVSDGTTITKK